MHNNRLTCSTINCCVPRNTPIPIQTKRTTRASCIVPSVRVRRWIPCEWLLRFDCDHGVMLADICISRSRPLRVRRKALTARAKMINCQSTITHIIYTKSVSEMKIQHLVNYIVLISAAFSLAISSPSVFIPSLSCMICST